MEMLLYLILAAVLYGILADRTDQAVEREMRKRREWSAGLHLVEDLDEAPDLPPRDGWFVRRVRGLRDRVRASRDQSASLTSGSQSVKLDPSPGELSTVRSPPIRFARSRLMARPSPVPSSTE